MSLGIILKGEKEADHGESFELLKKKKKKYLAWAIHNDKLLKCRHLEGRAGSFSLLSPESKQCVAHG